MQKLTFVIHCTPLSPICFLFCFVQYFEFKEKIFRCSEGRYGGSWGKGDGCRRQKDVENDDTLWPPLTKGKGRKEKKKIYFFVCLSLYGFSNLNQTNK